MGKEEPTVRYGIDIVDMVKPFFVLSAVGKLGKIKVVEKNKRPASGRSGGWVSGCYIYLQSASAIPGGWRTYPHHAVIGILEDLCLGITVDGSNTAEIRRTGQVIVFKVGSFHR